MAFLTSEKPGRVGIAPIIWNWIDAAKHLLPNTA